MISAHFYFPYSRVGGFLSVRTEAPPSLAGRVIVAALPSSSPTNTTHPPPRTPHFSPRSCAISSFAPLCFPYGSSSGSLTSFSAEDSSSPVAFSVWFAPYLSVYPEDCAPEDAIGNCHRGGLAAMLVGIAAALYLSRLFILRGCGLNE